MKTLVFVYSIAEVAHHYRKCAHRALSWPPHLWSVADDGTLCCRCASCRSLSPENAIYLADTGRAGPYLYGSNAVSCGSVGGVLTPEETVLQISTCSGKLSIKAVLLEITTYKWYMQVRKYMIHWLAA